MSRPRRSRACASALRGIAAGLIAWAWCAPSRAEEAPQAREERIPLAHFFASPELTQLRVSPNGRWIAGIAPDDDHQALAILDAETDSVVRLLTVPEPRLSPLFFGKGERRIADFWWVADERLMLSITRRGEHQSSLLFLGHDGSESHQLNHRPPTPMLYHERDELLSRLPDDARHVLVSFPRTRAREFLGADVRRIDVVQGRTETVQRAVPRVVRWFADPAGVLRAGYGSRRGWGFLRYRGGPAGSFEELGELGGVRLHPRQLRVLGVGAGPFLYVAKRRPEERFAIHAYDLEEGRYSPASFSHPRVDVSGPLVVDSRGVPLGVRYVDHYARTHWFESEWRERQRRIDAARPERVNRIESWDRAHARFVVRSESDRHDPVYSVWTEPDDELREVAREHPDLQPTRLVEALPVGIETQDGLTLPAYLTRPAGSQGPIPFLVEVRGGGWPRARRGFDPELQFLVSRGWGVLRVNARGTEGYGRRLEAAGDGAWGRAAQDDLASAARWLLRRGDADPAHVCAYGRGYGGYAALMAQLHAPDVFRCSVSVSGVSDPEAFLAHRARLLDEQEWRLRLDGAQPAPSPRRRAQQIQGPVFLAHGELDLVVPPEQSKAMASALSSAGVVHSLVLFEHDGHRILREESRLRLYGELERFLDALLATPEPSDADAPSGPGT